MQRSDVISSFLFSEEIYTDVFGDAVEPRGKCCVATESVDAMKRFYPCLLCQVFCGLGIFYLFLDKGIDFRLVFDNERVKGLRFTGLRAL